MKIIKVQGIVDKIPKEMYNVGHIRDAVDYEQAILLDKRLISMFTKPKKSTKQICCLLKED